MIEETGLVRKLDKEDFIRLMSKIVEWNRTENKYLYAYLMELSRDIDEPIEFDPIGFTEDFIFAGADEVEDGVYGDDIEEDHIAKFKMGRETVYFFHAR